MYMLLGMLEGAKKEIGVFAKQLASSQLTEITWSLMK